MASRNHATLSASAVSLKCSTTKAPFATGDTADHRTEVINARPGSLYLLEVCAVALNGAVTFGPTAASKAVLTRPIVSSVPAGRPISLSIAMNHGSAATTEEIQTVVEFYDATQRLGSTYVGSKESYQLDYEFDLA